MRRSAKVICQSSKILHITLDITVDSDVNNLVNMLPVIVELMKGTMPKINPIRGLFSPIRRPDGYYDLVVASSAVHHATNLMELLTELRRVLRSGGKLVILNETPANNFEMLLKYIRGFGGLIKGYVLRRSLPRVPEYSSNGILYDPYLGDHVYSRHQWHSAFAFSGFRYSMIRTSYSVYKGEHGARLTHFVCE